MISPMTICYALKLTHDFARSKYALERTDYNRKNLEELSRAVEEIDAGKLEIEGYERVEWTRFDPNDEATHPPKTDEYLVALDGWAFAQAVAFYKSDSAFDTREDVTHWRPIPKPPTETEAQK